MIVPLPSGSGQGQVRSAVGDITCNRRKATSHIPHAHAKEAHEVQVHEPKVRFRGRGFYPKPGFWARSPKSDPSWRTSKSLQVQTHKAQFGFGFGFARVRSRSPSAAFLPLPRRSRALIPLRLRTSGASASCYVFASGQVRPVCILGHVLPPHVYCVRRSILFVASPTPEGQATPPHQTLRSSFIRVTASILAEDPGCFCCCC